MKDAGTKGDKKEIETMISKLKGKDIPKLIAEGYGKFAAIGGGGGGGAAAAPAGGADAPAGEAKGKKEEKEEAKAEESAGSIGGFFGADEDDY